jgi:nitrate reductase gamma subunit
MHDIVKATGSWVQQIVTGESTSRRKLLSNPLFKLSHFPHAIIYILSLLLPFSKFVYNGCHQQPPYFQKLRFCAPPQVIQYAVPPSRQTSKISWYAKIPIPNSHEDPYLICL